MIKIHKIDTTNVGQLHCLDNGFCYINSILYADDSALNNCDLNSLSDRLTKFGKECASMHNNKADNIMIIFRPKKSDGNALSLTFMKRQY